MTDSPSGIVVYASPFCAPCEQLKRYLTQKGIEFQTRDVMMDEEAQDRLEEHRIRSAPALEVEGVIYAGDALTPEKINELVGA